MLLDDDDDDDDFQIPTLSQKSQPKTLKLTKTKHSSNPNPKHEPYTIPFPPTASPDFDSQICSLDCIQSSIDSHLDSPFQFKETSKRNESYQCNSIEARLLAPNQSYQRNSIEARLLAPREDSRRDECSELDVLLRLCSDEVLVQCPLCGDDISGLTEEERQVHSNHCLDEAENQPQTHNDHTQDQSLQAVYEEVVDNPVQLPQKVVDISPVLKWLRELGLARYEEIFIHEEIDWDTLQWLTEEDLLGIGITALGPRKKILHALTELRRGCTSTSEADIGYRSRSTSVLDTNTETSAARADDSCKPAPTKKITDFFPGLFPTKVKVNKISREPTVDKASDSAGRRVAKKHVRNGKLKDIPPWCSIPGTTFRVDAFKYLRGDCCHWFLTHFHLDHYQGLTRSFFHGKIYCSSITAKLVNTKIGIPWDRIEVLPLNKKTNVNGVSVTFVDANHCPGSVMIIFEPPNGKVVLHTGDFRYTEEMASILNNLPIHTLILDTTYCNPQYDFPKQEAVIQFVIEAIQAEAFNPKTLFLIGSYTIGKERLFLEVARVLCRKVYITSAKLRLMECLGFAKEDMQWFTPNEQESQIHVVPMWTLASFKRLKYISNQYASRFSLIVAFSPTGWTYGKGKKNSPGKRWQQGTIIRYEVPYSEHSSFTELKDFVKLVSPENIIPSVNNEGPDSTNAMVSLLSAPE